MELLKENGKTFLKGIMTESNFGTFNGKDFSFRGANRNGRFYPFDTLKESVLELAQRVQLEGVLAYRNHPNHSDLVYEDSAGKIVELTWDDESGRAICKVEILEDTKYGKQVLEDISNGMDYGISTRATGSLDEKKVVQPGLKMITADLIPVIEINGYHTSIQSCQSCTLSLTESIQDYYSDYLITEEVASCDCMISKLNKDELKVVQKYTINKILECLR